MSKGASHDPKRDPKRDPKHDPNQDPHQDWRTALWKGALTPSIVTSAIALVLGYLLRGGSGLAGSALATFTVLIFFSVHLFVARVAKQLDPTSTMILAMLSYMLKISAMAVFLLLVSRLTDPSDIDRTTFAISSLALATAWLAGEVRAFMKIRFVLDLSPGSTLKKESYPREENQGD